MDSKRDSSHLQLHTGGEVWFLLARSGLPVYAVCCRLAAEQVIADFIFPLPSASSASTSKNVDVDEVAWTDRLLNVMGYLDNRGVNAVLLLSGIKGSRPSPYELYLQCCIQNNVSCDLGCSGSDVHLMHQIRAVSSTKMRRSSNSDSTMPFDIFLVSLTTYDIAAHSFISLQGSLEILKKQQKTLMSLRRQTKTGYTSYLIHAWIPRQISKDS